MPLTSTPKKFHGGILFEEYEDIQTNVSNEVNTFAEPVVFWIFADHHVNYILIAMLRNTIG